MWGEDLGRGQNEEEGASMRGKKGGICHTLNNKNNF